MTVWGTLRIVGVGDPQITTKRDTETPKDTIYQRGVQEPEGFDMQKETGEARTMENVKERVSYRILKKSKE